MHTYQTLKYLKNVQNNAPFEGGGLSHVQVNRSLGIKNSAPFIDDAEKTIEPVNHHRTKHANKTQQNKQLQHFKYV